MPVSSITAEIKDFLKSVSDVQKQTHGLTARNQSISRRASVAICQYPVIVSDRISADTAFVISKALEAEFANFVLAYTSLTGISDTGNFSEYVRSFHNNIDMQELSTVTNPATISATVVTEGTLDSNINRIIQESVNQGNVEYMSLFNLRRLNEFAKDKTPTITGKNPTIIKNKVSVKQPEISIDNSGGAKATDYTVGITPTEIKRYNNATPTMLKITCTVAKEKSMINKDFHIGIKTRMEPVDSKTMVTELTKGIANNNAFFNFFRAATSEIEWMRDFVLNVDGMKDAATTSNTKNRYFNMMQSFKRRDKILRLISGKGLIPVTSIIFTEEEAAILKSQYMIDIKNPSVASKLMRDYFLIAIGIVDEASETVQFIFDSDIDYSSYTLKSLTSGTKSSDMESLLKILRR